jgi:hypothetical protein
MKISNGNSAVKSEKEMALALVESAPRIIPNKYISMRSYADKPSKPGS